MRLLSSLLMILQSRTLRVIALSTIDSNSGQSTTATLPLRSRADSIESSDTAPVISMETLDRRRMLQGSFSGILMQVSAYCGLLSISSPLPSHAYTPDPDPLKESLYLICRVQEATCLQERYINKKLPPIKKMKLTLRLVDRSYRLLDQINYISKFMEAECVHVKVHLAKQVQSWCRSAFLLSQPCICCAHHTLNSLWIVCWQYAGMVATLIDDSRLIVWT
ncbi:unnamed protein product [Cylindrotheca closterium]|uniref:Uncharacterized protein n=1 Tax=Cylindrotheca closterium TaxID=2856 RepID=A0AAD2GAW8_9STRA|nr:unnamed protein product [Cylindrotheca closterium]